ncbi:hypothetical protein DM611_01135 [Stenotrophomonas maltophilia]|nr:hypothetical protein DM611_01135 [Stenotrophomonas maltophilia]
MLRQAIPGGRERAAAAVLWRAAEDRIAVVPAAGRQPGTATEDHEVAGQRPALSEHHALLRQAIPGGRERAAAAVLWRAAEDRIAVVPAAGRQPGTATEDHEVASQRPALPEHHALLRQAMPGGRERAAYGPGGRRTSKRAPPSSLERPTASSPR